MGQPILPPWPYLSQDRLLLPCACTNNREGLELPSGFTIQLLLQCKTNLGFFFGGLWSQALPPVMPVTWLSGRGAGKARGCARQLTSLGAEITGGHSETAQWELQHSASEKHKDQKKSWCGAAFDELLCIREIEKLRRLPGGHSQAAANCAGQTRTVHQANASHMPLFAKLQDFFYRHCALVFQTASDFFFSVLPNDQERW